MASVDWKKIKTKQEVFAIMRHDCKDTRLKIKTHNNQELNKDLTHTNTGILDNYKTSKQRYETRMSELPAPRIMKWNFNSQITSVTSFSIKMIKISMK